MSVDDESTREFVAYSGAVQSRVQRISLIATAWLVVFIGSFFLVHGGLEVVVAAALVLVGAGWAAFEWRRWHRKIVIAVTRDGLTVNLHRGHLFSPADAPLGIWATMGVALHLQSGSRSFVLGGRDRRISAETMLDAPVVQFVDAWLWQPDFDALLTGPAPVQPARCLLFGNPGLAAAVSSFAIGKQIGIRRSTWHPQLAIDLGAEAIRVVDPQTGTAVATASPAQVIAAPVVFVSDSGSETPAWAATTVGLIVRVPGAEPLRIGCRDAIGLERRFWWRGNAPVEEGHATHLVSGGDWLALVDRFGLTADMGCRDHAT